MSCLGQVLITFGFWNDDMERNFSVTEKAAKFDEDQFDQENHHQEVGRLALALLPLRAS